MRILKYMAVALGLVVFSSCDDDTKTTLSPASFVPPTQLEGIPQNISYFAKAHKDSTITLSFKQSDYKVAVPVEYDLQLALKGSTEFQTFKSVSSTGEFKFTVGQINEFLQDKLAASADNEANIDYRIVSKLTGNDDIVSAVQSFSATPYLDVLWAENTTYMFGPATAKAAQNNKLNLVHQNGAVGKIGWRVIWLEKGKTFKFCSSPDFKGVKGKSGNPDASGKYAIGDEDIPTPGESGYYMVAINYDNGEFYIQEPKVYITGDVVGGWPNGTEIAENMFTTDEASKTMVLTKAVAKAELRLHVRHPYTGGDWWKNEFIIANEKIDYRADGGDQDRVSMTAGTYKFILDFEKGEGRFVAQ